MNTDIYINFIKSVLDTDGIKVADKANKIALKLEQITTEQYSSAARLIADRYLEDGREKNEEGCWLQKH